MTKYQENKLTMYETISTLLQNNSTIIKSLAAFGTAVDAFMRILGQIKIKINETQGAMAGKSANKRSTQKALITTLIKITAALMALAHRTQNNVLAEKAKVTPSQLLHTRDTELVTQATAIHAAALEVVPHLADYGIDIATLELLESQITAFNTALGTREWSVAEQKAARMALIDLFSQADTVLRRDLDQLVKLVKAEQPQFYNAYHSARVIKHLGYRSRPAPDPTAATNEA